MSKYKRIFIDSINFLVYALIYFTINLLNLLQFIFFNQSYARVITSASAYHDGSMSFICLLSGRNCPMRIQD